MTQPLEAIPGNDELIHMHQALLEASYRLGDTLRAIETEIDSSDYQGRSSLMDILIEAAKETQIVTMNLAQIIPTKSGISLNEPEIEDMRNALHAAYRYAKVHWQA